ncbi:MAG: class I adenylate-forming enzyme family protein, partial [Bacillota bacterium]|nr:class I adenylate-forming enzyme family protein [Bacillota bacterium]
MIYKSFGDLLRQAARRNGEKSAFIVKKKEEKSVKYINISYKKFYDDVRALGKVFDEKGYKDKRIAVIGKNCYEWILSLLAVSYIGAVAVPLDKGLSETEIMEQMDRINADTLIFDKDYSEIAKRNTGRENICFNADEGFENIDDLLEKGYKKGILPEMDSDADKLALLLFTSGTTSKSKIVMLSQ